MIPIAQGNDAVSAAADLATREGLEPNADTIIREMQARYPKELAAANLKVEDEEARAALDPAVVASLVDDEVLSYNVRGDALIIVHGDAMHKTAIPLSEVEGGKKRAPAKRRASAKK